MFFIGKESTLEAAEKAGEHCDQVYAYPSEDDCLWLGWSSDLDEDLEEADVRIALLMTICDELRIERAALGTVHQLPDSAIRTVLNSITGMGPMWWDLKGHKYLRQAAKKPKGFA